jgi:hypothetical protein
MRFLYHRTAQLRGDGMAMIDMTSALEAAQTEYRQRTVVNLVAAAFVSFLMISGYWIVSALAG